MESRRAKRRHDLERMKNKAMRVYGRYMGQRAIKTANHLALCSCWACGNQRRIEGDKISERRRAYEWIEGVSRET